MKTSLAAFGYWQDTPAKTWTRPGIERIARPDAQRIEERISRIVNQARDLSLFSPELSRQINDWPTRYHLGASRANILRPFQAQFPGSDILEIGAGCGAVTRFLGESGAHVTALEAAAGRASIARARTRDLPNVKVAPEHFSDFNPGGKFDFITLVGGIVNSGLFTAGGQPALRMIERAREMLKPGGRLIIAVENRLGAKYAGYEDDETQAYGRKELLGIINQAGFAGADILAPFPDYRFPVSIITESGFACEEFDSAALASEWIGQDAQLTAGLTSPMEGMSMDLASSLLVVATESSGEPDDARILAYHYPAHRSPDYCKEVTYIKTDDSSIELRVSVLETQSKPGTPGGYRRFILWDRCDYVRGTPLSLDLANIVSRDGWKIEEVGTFIHRYLDIAASLAGKTEKNLNADNIAAPISGRHIDLIPKNLIMGLDGEIHAIDQEWDFSRDISLGFLVFRTLVQLLYSKIRFGETPSAFRHTRLGFMQAAFRAAGFEVAENVILSYAKLEAASQSEVAQRALAVEEIFAPHSPLEIETVACAAEAPAMEFAELQERTGQSRRLESCPVRKWTTLWRRLKRGPGRAVRAS